MKETVKILDIKLVCHHCGNDMFSHQNTILNRRLFSILDMEWLAAFTGGRTMGVAYICDKCGLKHEFFGPMSKDLTELSKQLTKF